MNDHIYEQTLEEIELSLKIPQKYWKKIRNGAKKKGLSNGEYVKLLLKVK